jgi:hypothetical protein
MAESIAKEKLVPIRPILKPSQVVHLAQKLKLLLQLANSSRDEFTAALSTAKAITTAPLADPAAQSNLSERKRQPKNPDIITSRTIDGWFKAQQEVQIVHSEIRLKISGFFEAKLPRFKFTTELYQCHYDDFMKAVTDATVSTSSEVILTLKHPLADLDAPTIKLLVGHYQMLRFSFDNTKAIVSEYGVIRRSTDNPNWLTLDVYSPPVDSSRTVRSLSDADHFQGILFQLGKMFYAILSHAQGDASRIRYYHFPRLDGPRRVHYGIATGYSVNLREPVAAKVIVSKLPTSDRKDLHRFAQRLKRSTTATVRFKKLLVNSINQKTDFILSVDQALVVPLLPDEK